MTVVEVKHVVKTYGDNTVVDDVSFHVAGGEVFGLIGPNGAGRTTTIRMMMDLIRPDSGEVAVLGERFSEAVKDRIGYLPEERGLYRKMRVIDSLTYLASLKGMASREALIRAEELLGRVEMLPHRNKKTEELSRGMAQFLQFLATIMHDPDLVVLDEPFANLDPVNTQLIKRMVLELRDRGKAVLLSTHRMNEVEEMCDRILMIDRGKTVLYGPLVEIKARYKGDSVLVDCDADLSKLSGVDRVEQNSGFAEVFLAHGATPQALLAQLVGQGVTVNRFEVGSPPLNDIFLRVVGGKR